MFTSILSANRVIGLMLAATSLAAVSLTAASAADEPLEEMIVTASRRETPLQDTPIAVTAISSEQLRVSRATDLQSLSAVVPGLVVANQNATFGSSNLSVRGVGTQVVGVGLDVNVAIYVDGVYMPRATTTLQGFLDIERLEVLRGPQGTLFGRNATGGAVNIISKRPSDDFEGSVDLSAGNYGLWNVSGSLSGPFSERVRGRLSAMRYERDNYSLNLTSTETR